MNTLKFGDKVKIRSDLVVGEEYKSSTGFSVDFDSEMSDFLGKEVTISRLDNDGTFKIEGDTYDSWFTDTMIEQPSTKTLLKKPTYERKAERSDGITFERNAIGGRSLKEIEESIKERKESIKRDESLLRSHRNLFCKK